MKYKEFLLIQAYATVLVSVVVASAARRPPPSPKHTHNYIQTHMQPYTQEHTNRDSPMSCHLCVGVWGQATSRPMPRQLCIMALWGQSTSRPMSCQLCVMRVQWGQATSRPRPCQLCIMGYGGKRHLGPCRCNFVSWGIGASDI